MRLTKNKISILAALSETRPEAMLEWGPPPRNAATVAVMTDRDMRTVARTLRNMETQGLVVSETKAVDVWAELKRPGHYPKQLKCYWNAENYEQDKAAADEWISGAQERSEAAWQVFCDGFGDYAHSKNEPRVRICRPVLTAMIAVVIGNIFKSKAGKNQK